MARRKPGRKGEIAPVKVYLHPSVTAYAVTAPFKGSLGCLPHRNDKLQFKQSPGGAAKAKSQSLIVMAQAMTEGVNPLEKFFFLHYTTYPKNGKFESISSPAKGQKATPFGVASVASSVGAT